MAKAKKRKTKWYPGKLIEGVIGAKKRRLKKAYEAEDPKLINAKDKAKDRASGAGRVRKGAVGVKSTKGGEYVKYGKKSKPAKSFREAFAKARKEKGSGKTFTWDGRSYSTNTADDVKKEKAAKAKSKMDSEKRDRGATNPDQYAEGGKVESNPFGWPSRDARNGGKG